MNKNDTKAYVRKVLVAFLAVLVSLSSINLVLFDATEISVSANPETTVSGIITSDTTWTKANSPYSLTGPAGVSEGVTLTIEAGVAVNLNDYFMQVNGTLCARGSNADPICFNDGSGGTDSSGHAIHPITFTPLSTDWDEQTGTGCIIEHAVLSSTSVSIVSSPRICNSTFTECVFHIQTSWGGSGSNQYDSSPVIANNTFNGNGLSYGIIIYYSSATIAQNVISGYSTAISVNSDTETVIQQNYITDNDVGIRVNVHQGWSSPVIVNNTITGNSDGIYITRQIDVPNNPTIQNNNIYENSNYNINSELPTAINATNNWWGTTDETAISQSIRDSQDDFTLGTVTFIPFLTEENPETIQIPEITSLTLLSLLIITTLLVVICKRKQTNKQQQ